MRGFEVILGLIFVATLLQPLARRLDVPLAIAQVFGGVLLSALPFFPTVPFDPELTFVLFVPPLLYRAASTSSLRDTRKNARPILLLAVALVLVTIAAVAAVAHAIAPQIPWTAAFVLGAIVAPSDADVTTSIVRRLGLPPRLVTVLEGETLLNDTTAFVSYRMAVAAAAVGSFSIGWAASTFLIATVVGLAVGLAVGWVFRVLRQYVTDAVAVSTLSLATPFAAYLLAESVRGSGVLAVVAAGALASRTPLRSTSARTRVRSNVVWDTATFTVGALVFTLIGLQVGRLIPEFLRMDALSFIFAVALISVVVVATRVMYIFPAAYLPRLLSPSLRARDPIPPWRALVVLGWAGLRGGDTLVMALAVPIQTASGAPFPARDMIVSIAFGVILATLLGQGFTLRPLIKRFNLPRGDVVETEERRAREEAEQAAMQALEEIGGQGHIPANALVQMRAAISQRTRLDLDDTEHAGGHTGLTLEDAIRDAEQQVRDASRDAVARLRDDEVIGDAAFLRVLSDLDLDEVRNIDEPII
ncbi:MAG: Na+/H+ antiporter [Gemmatimonadaceae bacterium]